MAQQSVPVTREDLPVRRAKLEKSLAVFTDDHQITSLVDKVDSALSPKGWVEDEEKTSRKLQESNQSTVGYGPKGRR